MSEQPEATSQGQILDLIAQLDKRLKRVESLIDWSAIAEREKDQAAQSLQNSEEKSDQLESQIGTYWLAKVGAILLLIGTGFFISYPIPGIPALLMTLLGFLAVGATFGLSRIWQNSNQDLSQILYAGSLFLLYFAVLKLSFLSKYPLFTDQTIGFILLLGTLGLDFYLAITKKREILTAALIALGFFSALVVDLPALTLSLIVVFSLLAVTFGLRNRWAKLLMSSLFLAFLTHLVWLCNNPVMGHPFQGQANHSFNLAYLLSYSALFAVAQIAWGYKLNHKLFDSWMTAINAGGVVFIGGLNVLLYFRQDIALLGFATSAYFLLLAIAYFHTDARSHSNFLWACFGYVVLSVTIFAILKAPDFFVLLGLQSLLVIVTAVWFRSKLLVLANIAIYGGIYLAYFIVTKSNDFVNLSYAVTALASARILNWQKERLAITTELMRNIYLGCAFFIILYGLSYAVPSGLISLSWLGAAIFYFAMSLILKNSKYWWMAILTIAATVLRVLVFDMARLEAGLRIISFLVIGIVLVMLSIISAKRIRSR